MQLGFIMRFAGKRSTAILTVSEVSRYLRIHPTTLYRLLRKHQLPGFKIGNDWRISAQAMDRWLTEMEDLGARPSGDVKNGDGPSALHSNDAKINRQK